MPDFNLAREDQKDSSPAFQVVQHVVHDVEKLYEVIIYGICMVMSHQYHHGTFRINMGPSDESVPDLPRTISKERRSFGGLGG